MARAPQRSVDTGSDAGPSSVPDSATRRLLQSLGSPMDRWTHAAGAPGHRASKEKLTLSWPECSKPLIAQVRPGRGGQVEVADRLPGGLAGAKFCSWSALVWRSPPGRPMRSDQERDGSEALDRPGGCHQTSRSCASPYPRARHRADGIGAVCGSWRASSGSWVTGPRPGSTMSCTATRMLGRRCGRFRPSCSRPTRAWGSSTATCALCSRSPAAQPAVPFARRDRHHRPVG